MVPGAVELVGWDLWERMERRDEGGVGLALAEALIELLAEGGRQASEFAISNHPARSIPFKVGDVKGLNALNARKRGKDRRGQRGGQITN